MQALKLDQIPQVPENTFKGGYIVTAVSKDEQWLKVKNLEDTTEFEMKVATYHKGIESGRYTAYDDDSFDIKRSESNIEW